MDEFSLLLGFSQLAIALAGFVSLFLILLKDGKKFSPEDGVGIRAILYCSLGVAIFSILPILIVEFGTRKSLAFRSSAAIFVFVAISLEISIFSNWSKNWKTTGKTINILSLILSIVAILSLFFIVFWSGQPSFYLFSLAVYLLVGIINFGWLAITRLLSDS